jgi:hypothetical protein
VQVRQSGHECSTYYCFLAWLSSGYPGWLDVTSGEILYTEQENPVATNHIYGRPTEMPSGMEILIILLFITFLQVVVTIALISSSTRRGLRAVSLPNLIH